MSYDGVQAMPPAITYVLPCLNEAAHLPATLASLDAQEGLSGDVEVIVVDGGSSDDSARIVESFAPMRGTRVMLAKNPRRTAAAGFNVGFKMARGPVVVFGGARAVFPPAHAATVLEAMEISGAAVVGGGVSRFRPARSAILERAIASLYESPVGAGAAAYHRRRTPGFVDSVYCGAYRRAVLEEIGGVDERFTRGQDTELNSRVRKAGYQVWFDPRLSTEYQFRGGLGAALQRGYNTGRHAAIGWKLQPHTVRLRHLVPLGWTAFVGASVFFAPWPFTAAVYLIYFGLLVWSALRLRKRIGIASALCTIPVFALFHLSYGLGEVRGLVNLGRP